MPKRPVSHVNEDISRAKLHSIFASKGWTAEDLHKDYGEDILVRIFEGEEASPWYFFIQVKACVNISKLLTPDAKYLEYRLTAGHVTQWQAFAEPVFFIIWDSTSDIFYWEILQTPEIPLRYTRTGVPVLRIPLDNTLDAEGISRIASRTKTRARRLEVEREGAQILIDLLTENFQAEIDYNPEAGVLYVQLPSQKAQIILFGKLDAHVRAHLDNTGQTPEEFLEQIVRLNSKVSDTYDKGGLLRLTDSAGSVVKEWKTFDDLMRGASRSSELWPE